MRPSFPAPPAHPVESDGRDLQLPTVATSPTSAGCPAPLGWREVLEAYESQRTVHPICCDGDPVSVSTWGTGPPLYLLGGMLGDERLFTLLAWLLREEHTCVLSSWQQLGAASKGDPSQQLSRLATAVLHVADSLGQDRFAIHATSFGCLVGLQMLVDVPDRIEWASLQGGFAARQFSWPERLLLALARRSRRSLGEFAWAVRILRHNYHPWFPPFDATRWEFFENQAGETPICELARLSTIAGAVDLRSRLAEITTPVLILHCEGAGRVAWRSEQQLIDGLARASVQVLDNCGSLPHLTHPHRLAKLLRTFRDEQTAERR